MQQFTRRAKQEECAHEPNSQGDADLCTGRTTRGPLVRSFCRASSGSASLRLFETRQCEQDSVQRECWSGGNGNAFSDNHDGNDDHDDNAPL
jgi:hypothetical protein